MFDENFDEQCGGMEDPYDMGMWAKEFGKEFKIASLKKKERILEAKLEFIREINRLIEKSSEAPKEKEEE
jgi:hypothetical protein